jgi:hypothetical protein
MLGRILGNHSQVHTFGELHFFEQQVDVPTVSNRPIWTKVKLTILLERLLTSSRDGFFNTVIPGKYKDDVQSILSIVNNNDAVSSYRAFLDFETEKNNKLIPCEQTPRYLFSVEEILEIFPGCRIINMVRDPRDVLLSQKHKWRRRFLGAKTIPLIEAFRSWVNYHPYIITRLWVSAVRESQRHKKSKRFVTVRFEDILESPENEVKALCKFVGIEFEKNMLTVPRVGSSMRSDNPEKKGIDGSHSAAWKKGGLSKGELSICQQIAAREMKLLDYKFELISISVQQKVFSMLSFLLKTPIALLMNLRRNKNIFQSIRRRLLVSSEEPS